MYKLKPIERFEIKIDKLAGGCWMWKSNKASNGHSKDYYGIFWTGETSTPAHRFSYEYYVAPIPEGMTVDHMCETTLCVKPEHLRLLSRRDNILAGTKSPTAINARKTHCIHGHEFTVENTYITKPGHRKCRICDRRNKRNWYAKQK